MIFTVISLMTMIVGFFTVNGLQAKILIQRYFSPQLSTFRQRLVIPQNLTIRKTSRLKYRGQLGVPVERTGRILPAQERQIFVRRQRHLPHGVPYQRSMPMEMKSSTQKRVDIDKVPSPTTVSTRVNTYHRNAMNETPESVIKSPIATLRTINSQQSVYLLNNLESKRTEIPNLQNDKLVQIHLDNLKEMREADNSSLAIQVKYIKAIKSAPIRNQVLKIFVKSILMKDNSTLNNFDQNALNINDLNVLVEIVGEILDTLMTTTSVANAVNDSFDVYSLKTTISATTIPTTERNSMQTRIKNTVLSYVRTSLYGNVQTTILPSESGRKQSPIVGTPISVGSSIRSVNYTTVSFTDLQKQQDATTQFLPSGEPLGGVAVYWTHLSSSLADMLCSLCRQQKNVSCTRKYCNNDNVDWTDVTRSTV